MVSKMLKAKKLVMASIIAAIVVYCAVASTPVSSVENAVTTPDKVLQDLKQGNERFVSGKCTHPDLSAARIAETAKNGQHPTATIITCSDSRVPVELIFDQGIGDIFVIRVAGNVCDTDEVGSIEYGVGHLKTPLLVVLGHTGCGAVTAVVTGAELHGNIAALVDNIKPAVAKAAEANPHLCKEELIPEAIKANCWQSIEDLFKASPEVRELVKTGKLQVAAAIYNISTGKVGWLGQHPEQAKLVNTDEKTTEIVKTEKKVEVTESGHGH